MTISNQQLRPAWTAIAAVLALSATPAFAQEVTPDPTAPTTTTAPPSEPVATTPVTDVAPPASTATDSPSAATTNSDPLAPVAAAPTSESTPARRERANPTRTSNAAPRATPAPKAVVNDTPAAPLAETAPVAAEVAAPAATTAFPGPAPAVAPAADAVTSENALPIAGAAGLGILALAGAGFAMRRRRRSDEGVAVPVYDEPRINRSPDPVVDRAPSAAPSAFAWGQSPQPIDPAPASTTSGPGHHLAAARHGPTPENPFLSLKKRLKRASFFEQRDRLVAQGRADPVAATAGLPDAMARTARHAREAVRRHSNAMATGVSFNRSFQPA